MEKTKLINAINELSKIIHISKINQDDLFAKYFNKSEMEVIKDFSMICYKVLKDDIELYDKALNVVRNINPYLCPDIEEMKEKLNNVFINQSEGNKPLIENKNMVVNSLRHFCNLFNKNRIDYYVVGILPCFLKIKKPLFRYHDDLDIMINENDISKVNDIMEANGYQFYDDRFPTIER